MGYLPTLRFTFCERTYGFMPSNLHYLVDQLTYLPTCRRRADFAT